MAAVDGGCGGGEASTSPTTSYDDASDDDDDDAGWTMTKRATDASYRTDRARS